MLDTALTRYVLRFHQSRVFGPPRDSYEALRKRIRDDVRIGTMEDSMQTKTRKAIYAPARGCLFLFLAGTVALFQGCSSSSGSGSAAGASGSGGATLPGGAVSGGSPAATGGNSTPSGGI